MHRKNDDKGLQTRDEKSIPLFSSLFCFWKDRLLSSLASSHHRRGPSIPASGSLHRFQELPDGIEVLLFLLKVMGMGCIFKDPQF